MSRGLAPPPGAERPLPPLRPAAGCSWWARARGGAVALEGHLTFAPGAPARECSRPPGLHACSRLPPPSLFRAAAPNDSWGPEPRSAQAVLSTLRWSLPSTFHKVLRDKKEPRESPPTPQLHYFKGTISPISRFFWGVCVSEIYFQEVSSRKRFHFP